MNYLTNVHNQIYINLQITVLSVYNEFYQFKKAS